MTKTKTIAAFLRRVMHEARAGREAVQGRGAVGEEVVAPTVLQGELLDLIAEVFGEYEDDTDAGEALAVERFALALDVLSPDGRDHELVAVLDDVPAGASPEDLARAVLGWLRYVEMGRSAPNEVAIIAGARRALSHAGSGAAEVARLLRVMEAEASDLWATMPAEHPGEPSRLKGWRDRVASLAYAAFASGGGWEDGGCLTVRAACDVFGHPYPYQGDGYSHLPGWRAARDLGTVIDVGATAKAPPPRARMSPEQLRDLEAAIALQERQIAELTANTGIDPATDTEADVGPVEVLRAAARVAWRTLEQLRRCRAGSPAEVPASGNLATTQALVQIAVERARQRQRWGDVHDDGHDPFDWIELIRKRSENAAEAVADGNDHRFGTALIQIAALSVAGVEAMERCRARDGQLPVILLDAPPALHPEPVELVRAQLASLRALIARMPDSLLAELDAIEGVIVADGAP